MAKSVQFIAKVERRKNLKDLTEEERNLRHAKKIIDPYYDEEEEDEVAHRKVIIDLEMVADVIDIDDDYIQVIMRHGVVHILKVSLERYKLVYQEVLSVLIREVGEEDEES